MQNPSVKNPHPEVKQRHASCGKPAFTAINQEKDRYEVDWCTNEDGSPERTDGGKIKKRPGV